MFNPNFNLNNNLKHQFNIKLKPFPTLLVSFPLTLILLQEFNQTILKHIAIFQTEFNKLKADFNNKEWFLKPSKSNKLKKQIKAVNLPLITMNIKPQQTSIG